MKTQECWDMYFLIKIHRESGAVVRRCFVKRVFSQILQNSKENTYARVCLGPATLLKKILWHRYFPVNFAKFFKNTFWYRTSPENSPSGECWWCNKQPRAALSNFWFLTTDQISFLSVLSNYLSSTEVTFVSKYICVWYQPSRFIITIISIFPFCLFYWMFPLKKTVILTLTWNLDYTLNWIWKNLRTLKNSNRF